MQLNINTYCCAISDLFQGNRNLLRPLVDPQQESERKCLPSRGVLHLSDEVRHEAGVLLAPLEDARVGAGDLAQGLGVRPLRPEDHLHVYANDTRTHACNQASK